MQDVEIIGMLKSYINKTLVGMGALKGAPCTVKSVEEDPGVHVITLEWTDNDGNKQTKAITVLDGTDGTDGTDGFSPKVTVKTSTDSTYILTITTIDGSYDTPNLKGGGSGGASSMDDLTDVLLTDLANGQILKWDSTESKWVNVSLGDAAYKDSTNEVTEGSTDLLESGAAFTALADKVDKEDGKGLSTNDFTDALKTKVEDSADDISVNGVAQTITDGAVDLDIANNLITEAQWTAINGLYA